MTEKQIPPAEDAEVWERYHPLDPEEAIFQLLTPSQEIMRQERDAFNASGRTYLPDLRPRSVDIAALDAWRASLLELKQEVPKELTSEHLKQAYRWRINEGIANLGIVKAAAAGDTKKFAGYNNFIYGPADKKVFEAVSDWLCSDAEQHAASDRPEIREAAGNVLSALGSHRGDKSLLIPKAEVFDAVRDDHFANDGFIALLMAGVELPATGPVDATTGDPALRRMLTNIGSKQRIEDAPSWSNTPTSLRRPADFVMSSAQEFIEYNVHELSHAVENLNGSAGPVKLASSGFDRYERGNEGKAVVREQVANKQIKEFTDGQRWQELMGRQLSVSLGDGLAGSRMDFAATFDIIYNAALIYEYTHSPEADKEKAAQRADDMAWSITVGAYKGTDGSGTSVYRRPKIYLEGNIAIWEIAERNPRAIREGDLGKFDLSNTRHIAIMQKSGALPAGDIVE